MKRLLFLVITLALALPAAARAADGYDELSCGPIENTNQSWQFGQFAWVEYIVQTRRQVNLCPLSVSVEGWVVGITSSHLSDSDMFTAEARRQVPVFTYGTWQTNGKHFRTWLGAFTYDNGSTVSLARVRRPQMERDPAYDCMLEGGTWDGWHCYLPNCPIIVDVGRNGYRLTGVEDGVRFDLDADGVAELVAWTEPDSDDAFLVMDRNGNGQIDSGAELFGNNTPVYADGTGRTMNGFEALEFLETMSYGQSRRDSVIDSRDVPFGRLMLWRDANHNGVSEPDELTPAGAAGVAAINTEYKEKRRVDGHKNQFRQKGEITWSDGAVGQLYDVWLQWRD